MVVSPVGLEWLSEVKGRKRGESFEIASGAKGEAHARLGPSRNLSFMYTEDV